MLREALGPELYEAVLAVRRAEAELFAMFTTRESSRASAGGIDWLLFGLPGDQPLEHLLVALGLQVAQREAAPDEQEQLLGRARG